MSSVKKTRICWRKAGLARRPELQARVTMLPKPMFQDIASAWHLNVVRAVTFAVAPLP